MKRRPRRMGPPKVSFSFVSYYCPHCYWIDPPEIHDCIDVTFPDLCQQLASMMTPPMIRESRHWRSEISAHDFEIKAIHSLRIAGCDWARIGDMLGRTGDSIRLMLSSIMGCPYCLSYYRTQAALSRHTELHNQQLKGQNTWRCCFCDGLFPSLPALNEHRPQCVGIRQAISKDIANRIVEIFDKLPKDR
ncbi:hypothetical protein BGZ63DRAFT_171399 [Mariannaea sp. PMI_226]|nr:hypothetical protein BGZ63DRAFT_171399 [Mariannaea sp. PMI_226]